MLHIEGTKLLKCNISTTGHVVIPDGIEYIEANAFKDCSLVTRITIPESVKKLGWTSVFEGCISLQNVVLPNTIIELPSECFKNCISLETVKLPENLVSIAYEAFKGCSNLKKITLSSKISALGASCFEGCISLSNISIPPSLTKICCNLFSGCQSLEEILIPPKIYNIGLNAFKDCTSLVKVSIKNEYITISPTAFIGCTLLNQLTIAGNNPYYAITSFADCTNLKRITLEYDDNKKVFLVDELKREHSQELKYMSMYYRQIGMNITQMKWAESLKNEKSFKEPIDQNWEQFKYHRQSLSYILDINWDNSEGIGLVLGFNRYRALDIDDISLFILKCRYGDDALNQYINLFLEKLGLPSDYPWVIISGSGCGFHIIFKTDDLNENIDSISYSPNDVYRDDFRRIELRWCDHLILPPSLHASGNRYRFRENKIPATKPNEIKFSDIDNLIEFFCSEIQIKEVNYNSHRIELAENLKIYERHDSYLTPHERNEDSIEWLQKSNTNENKNSLAVRHLLQKGVEFDKFKAKDLLESSNTQSSIFNLLSLYSCGFYMCEYGEYLDKYSKLDKTLFNEDSIQLIENNARTYIQKEDIFLFFDTETIGLPNDYNAPITNVNNWPRIIQISWILATESKKIVSKKDYIIKPVGFEISEESTKIHGITNDIALHKGEDIEMVISSFLNDYNKADYIVGHNVKFDINVLSAELFRMNNKINLFEKPQICTMQLSVELCKIPNIWGSYKFPKLQELYYKLFNKFFEDAHNSMSDVKATFDCFYELRSRGVIKIKNKTTTDLPF